MVGGGFGIAGLVVLLVISDRAIEYVASSLYGFGLIAVFTASSVFHAVQGRDEVVAWLERLDHVAIYLLIAGTYTPVTLLYIGGAWGWSLFGVSWGIALIGIILALTVPLGPTWLHIAGYIALGWLAVIAAPKLLPVMNPSEITLIIGGGVIYTFGSFFYVWDRPDRLWNLDDHAIWHMAVIVAAAMHWAFVAFYVL